ncbi:MAG: nucleotidyltransferase family protein [Phycisphaerales bacterium]|nr:nucleotidyltransferase family protein [Phycisphaerales bacterium]
MSSSPPTIRVAAIIPAAGMSRRMGRPKQTLRIGAHTLVGHVASVVLDAGADPVVVVTRTEFRDACGLPEDPRLFLAINDDADSQMLDSIWAGLDALSSSAPRNADGVMVVPGDMPLLNVSTVAACIAAFRAEPGSLIKATYNGAGGHPLIFPYELAPRVRELKVGLRELTGRFPERVRLIPCDETVAADVDTPQDYENALHRASAGRRDH